MGILKRRAESNILTDHGFKYVSTSAAGHLTDCYEIGIKVSSLYYVHIAVKPETNEFAYYLEYDCGGEVASDKYTLTDILDFDKDPSGFFDRLDEETTAIVERWR